MAVSALPGRVSGGREVAPAARWSLCFAIDTAMRRLLEVVRSLGEELQSLLAQATGRLCRTNLHQFPLSLLTRASVPLFTSPRLEGCVASEGTDACAPCCRCALDAQQGLLDGVLAQEGQGRAHRHHIKGWGQGGDFSKVFKNTLLNH